MRNKELVEDKVERLLTKIKIIGYHINRDEKDEAYNQVGIALDTVEEILSLLNLERQEN